MATYVGEMQYLIIGDKEYSLPTGGGGSGTVTSVAVSNATNGGMSISGSPITSSGAITIGHSNVLASAQTTQAVYPIKIDKNGHISAYGSAVTIPTKTSDLTNDSGFITSYTDTKNTAGSTNSTSKLYLIGATEQSANPQTYSNNNLYYDSINGFYVKSPTYSNSYSCIKQDDYGCTNIYAYSSSDDMPLSTILASSSEVFLGNRSSEMGYNSSISINDGDIYLSPGANDKHVYIYNLGAPTNDGDAATKKYVDDSIPTVPSNIVNTITTTAGAHTAITSQTGNVSFNVPTTASDVGAAASDHTHGNITNGGDITATAPTIANGDQIIINDNSASKITNGPTFDGSTTTKALTPKGTWETFSNTDEKLAVSEAYINASYNVLLGYGESAQTRQLDGGLSYQRTSGTPATANLYIGSGGHSSGNLILEDGISHYTTINTDTQTANRIITLPDKTGTVALTSDIPSVPTITLNGSSTTTPSFYAATGAGTSGQYLKSNGSGAPTWTNFPTIPSITLNGSSTTSPSFYAPTSAGTSGYVLKSNGSGAPTWTSATLTDEKLRVYALNTTAQTAYDLVLSHSSSTAETKYVTNGLQITHNDGSATVEGNAILKIGTNVAKGTAGNQTGKINLYGDTAYRIELKAGSPTSHQIIAFPDKSGTIALTSDIPSVPTITLNGSSTTSPSFYAPTSTGTNGYYLKSNGSGAPTWSSIDPTYLSNGSASIVLYGLSYGHRMIRGFTVAQSDTNDTCELSIGGNASGEGTGLISLHTGDTNYSTTLVPDSSLSADRTITLPDKTGTVALISDIPVSDVTVGGTSVVTNGVATIASPIQIVRW